MFFTFIHDCTFKVTNNFKQLNYSPDVPCSLVKAAHLVVEVGEAAVALRGSVKLPDAFDAETFSKRFPNIDPQTVAHGNTHLVTGL